MSVLSSDSCSDIRFQIGQWANDDELANGTANGTTSGTTELTTADSDTVLSTSAPTAQQLSRRIHARLATGNEKARIAPLVNRVDRVDRCLQKVSLKQI